MSKLSFEQFIVNMGIREGEKMNTCHDNLGQFCSGGGGMGNIGENVTGPTEVLEKVSQENHPMHDLYKFPNTNFETENQARLNLGKGRDSGQYLVRYSDGKFNVMGEPKGTKKKLFIDVDSADMAIKVAEDHFETRTGKPFIKPGSAEWFRKHPETSPIRHYYPKS